MKLIASSLPGRMRLRHQAWRQVPELQELATAAGRWPGILGVDANPLTGSLLLHYDPDRLPQAELEAAIATMAREHLPEPPAGGRREPRRGRGTPRVRANRVAKRGMVITLAASLALAAARSKRWHIYTGNAFLAFLAIHLYVYRRHLLR